MKRMKRLIAHNAACRFVLIEDVEQNRMPMHLNGCQVDESFY